MSVTVSRHVFGTVQGYRTLGSSSDVTPDELRELESFVFGQTDDDVYLDSLAHTPAYWSRRLSSGRRALTRVLRGRPDDKGRAALLLVTAIISAEDWLRALRGDDTVLLGERDLWDWHGEPSPSTLHLDVSGRYEPSPTKDERARVISLLAAVEACTGQSEKTIVVDEPSIEPEDLRLLTALLPEKERLNFSYAVRGLSEGLPVALNCLTNGASRGKSRRQIIRWPATNLHRPLTSYASAISHFWDRAECPPLEFASNCSSFTLVNQMIALHAAELSASNIRVRVPGKVQDDHERSPRNLPKVALWVTSLAIFVLITASVVGLRLVRDKHLKSLLGEIHKFRANHVPLDRVSNVREREQEIAEAESLSNRLTELRANEADGHVAMEDGFLRQWLESARERDERCRGVESVLDDFDTFQIQLGLKDLPRVYPGKPQLDGIRALKDRLLSSGSVAEDLGDPYPQKIERALSLIAEWEIGIAKVLEDVEEQLGDLSAAFGGKPPGTLSSLVLEELKHQTDLLERLEKDVKNVGESNVEDQVKTLEYLVKEAKNRCQKRRQQIDSMKQEFHDHSANAGTLIDEAQLRLDPPGDPWKIADLWSKADEARRALTRAQTLWPENEEPQQQAKIVSDWMAQASRMAYEYFDARVREAEDMRKGSQERDLQPALEILGSAIRYWNIHEAAMEYHDGRTTKERYHEATRLESELRQVESAEAKGKATSAPSPRP